MEALVSFSVDGVYRTASGINFDWTPRHMTMINLRIQDLNLQSKAPYCQCLQMEYGSVGVIFTHLNSEVHGDPRLSLLSSATTSTRSLSTLLILVRATYRWSYRCGVQFHGISKPWDLHGQIPFEV
jgi:hypothetical protein